MTQEQHPITPPKHLLSYWEEEINYGYAPNRIEEMLTEASRWGADQELYACCEWLQDSDSDVDTYKLRNARRSKPPSLKEQALAALEKQFAKEFMESDERDIIRRALEALPD